MTFSDTTRHRLVQLVLLLGSDKDGEVVAAARGMVRILAIEKKDLHDLVRLIDAQAAKPQPKPRPEPQPRPRPQPEPEPEPSGRQGRVLPRGELRRARRPLSERARGRVHRRHRPGPLRAGHPR